VLSALSPLLWMGLLCTMLSIVGAWFVARALRKQIEQTEDNAKAKLAAATEPTVVYRVEN
jgi:sensor histidine kinase regulating citrate/malate metabolism